MVLLFDLRGEMLKAKMSEYFTNTHIKFRILDPKIQIKRPKCLILTYLHTYCPTLVIESA